MTSENVLELAFVMVFLIPFAMVAIASWRNERNGEWHLHERVFARSVRTIDGENIADLEIKRRYIRGRWQYKRATDEEKTEAVRSRLE